MATPYVSRSGRVIKAPVLYEPVEKPEDDFKEDEYDEDADADGSDLDEEEEDEEDDEDEDADEHGNLKGFVVDDEDDDEDCD
jgi:hypothetical protein